MPIGAWKWYQPYHLTHNLNHDYWGCYKNDYNHYWISWLRAKLIDYNNYCRGVITLGSTHNVDLWCVHSLVRTVSYQHMLMASILLVENTHRSWEFLSYKSKCGVSNYLSRSEFRVRDIIGIKCCIQLLIKKWV